MRSIECPGHCAFLTSVRVGAACRCEYKRGCLRALSLCFFLSVCLPLSLSLSVSVACGPTGDAPGPSSLTHTLRGSSVSDARRANTFKKLTLSAAHLRGGQTKGGDDEVVPQDCHARWGPVDERNKFGVAPGLTHRVYRRHAVRSAPFWRVLTALGGPRDKCKTDVHPADPCLRHAATMSASFVFSSAVGVACVNPPIPHCDIECKADGHVAVCPARSPAVDAHHHAARARSCASRTSQGALEERPRQQGPWPRRSKRGAARFDPEGARRRPRVRMRSDATSQVVGLRRAGRRAVVGEVFGRPSRRWAGGLT